MKSSSYTTEPEIPVVTGTAVVPVATTHAATVGGSSVVIDLPVNENSGLIFSDSPPRVTQVTNPTIEQEYGSAIQGLYFSSLRMPGLAITDIYDSNRLRELLLANQALPRQITLSRQAPLSNQGCRYRHELPTNVPLGIVVDGFPPVVKEVSSGPLAGKISPGQTVDMLCVPGQRDLSLQSGGFTAHRINLTLNETAHIPGRELIVKDRADHIVTEPRGQSNAAFDMDGCCKVM